MSFEVEDEYPKSVSQEYDVKEGELLRYNGKSDVLSIPEGVTKFKSTVIGDEIRTVMIPASVKYILPLYARHYSLTDFIVNKNNDDFCDVDGVLFNKDKTVLIRYPNSKEHEQYSVPDGVKRIDDSAFSYCNAIEKIILPDSVEEIGYGAFAGCKNLIDIYIPKTLKICEGCAFKNTPWLKSQKDYVIIGDGILINYLGCDEHITIPKSVKEIAAKAFCCNINIKSVKIPDSVVKIGQNAFDCCHKLEEIYISDSVTDIGWEAFDECTSLRNVRLSENIINIGVRTFHRCTALEHINIPDSVKFIHSSAFGRCTSLSHITFGKSLEEISSYAFDNCKSLKAITIPDSVKNVTKQIFSYCNEVSVNYKGELHIIDGMEILDNDIATL